MRWWLVVPALLAAALGAAAMALHIDLRVADAVYRLEGHHWLLRSATITEPVLHVLGRNAVAAAWLGVVVAWLWTWKRPAWRHARRPLGALALSVLLSTSVVSWIKSWSNVDCPWDLARYGGSDAYLSLLADRPAALHAACFPAGHSSAGYGWVALYFFFISVRPAWRCRGLAGALGLGLVFGVSQQLRGAHFLSHDLWTLGICWLVALMVHATMGLPLRPGDPRR